VTALCLPVWYYRERLIKRFHKPAAQPRRPHRRKST